MSKLDNVYLLPYKKELKEIFTRAVEESESYEWLYEQDKKDFEKVIPILFKKFQEMEWIVLFNLKCAYRYGDVSNLWYGRLCDEPD